MKVLSPPAADLPARGGVCDVLLSDERNVIALSGTWELGNAAGAAPGGILVGRGCGLVADAGAHCGPEDVLRELSRATAAAQAMPVLGFVSYDARNAFEPAVALGHSRRFPLLGFWSAREWAREGEPDLVRFSGELLSGPGSVGEYGELGCAEYVRRVRAIQEEIRAGEYYELNFTQRFRVRSPAPPGLVALRLRATARAPYWAYLRWDDQAVISASPELFLRREGNRIWTKPIKGSAPRGGNAAEDRQLKEGLCRDEKNAAEHTMVVDLARNDLGRICRYGTVETIDRAAVETFPTVHHLVSTVAGELWDGVTTAAVLEATFPAASITGCPKVGVMRAIDVHETSSRGLYTGAVGWMDGDGDMEWNVAIRTLTARQAADGLWDYEFGAGGAVVADSIPEEEYRESLLKARPLYEAIRWSEASADGADKRR